MKKKATYHPEHRTHVITVRMNEDEWQMFQQRLQDSGMMQSDFVRQAVATAKVDVHIHSVYDSEVLDQIAAELGKIGSNMNQIASKNADYTVAEQYLIFQHDESSGKLLLDESGYPMLREKYILQGINCDAYNFAAECRKANRKYKKNKGETEIKTHHYIISFDPKDKVEPGLTIEKAQEMGMAFAAEHFPGHQMLVCAHEDGHNGAGNIHVHIVLNSLWIQDIEPLPYKQRRCDCRAGFKHNCTKDFMRYLRNDLMEFCREQGLHQVDLNRSNRRVTNEEYRAGQRGQETLDRENEVLIQKGQKPKRTKFETEKEKIRQAIQKAVAVSHSPEEFQKILQEQYGIQVKESGEDGAIFHREG